MSRLRYVKVSPGKSRAALSSSRLCSRDRGGDLLVRHIDRLRQAYKLTADRYPFETIAICILPDHLPAIWSLPTADVKFPLRLGIIKSKFSRGLPSPELRSRSQIQKRDKGIWQRRYWEHAISR